MGKKADEEITRKCLDAVHASFEEFKAAHAKHLKRPNANTLAERERARQKFWMDTFSLSLRDGYERLKGPVDTHFRSGKGMIALIMSLAHDKHEKAQQARAEIERVTRDRTAADRRRALFQRFARKKGVASATRH